MNMESLKLIRLTLLIILIIIIDLIIDSNCKPGGWSFAKLNLWGRSSKPSSEASLEPESDSSVKYAELCEYICKKEPEKGVKYCDCDSNDSLISSSSSPSSSSLSSEQNQISLSDYFKQETNPSMRQQMCSLICLEDSNEASKYCECDDTRTQGKSINSKQSMKSSSFQSLSDYFKSNNNNGNDKTINSDENTRRQLCEYICSDEDPDEGKLYCDCNKIKQEQINLIAQQYHHNSNEQQRQGNPNNNNNINGGVNNNFSIKSLLPVNHGHSREDICKLVCVIEPESDDGQCGCDDGQKESRFRWPWQSIRQWFG